MFEGFGTSFSSSNPAAPSFQCPVSSSSSTSSQILTSTRNVQIGGPKGLKITVSSDSGSLKCKNDDIKFSKATRCYKSRVSSDTKPEEVKKDSKMGRQIIRLVRVPAINNKTVGSSPSGMVGCTSPTQIKRKKRTQR